jgi:hypothetical protein
MTDRLWNWDEPLQRCPEIGESRAANQGLHDYALMGPRRSLRSLLEQYSNVPPTKKPPTRYFHTLATWSNKYDWVARVNRWQKLGQDRAQEEWRERQNEIRDREWGQAEALIEKAQHMLDFPLSTQKITKEKPGPDDNTIIQEITVKPVRWSSSTVAQYLDMASKLARLAAEMETENIKVAATVGFTADDLAAASSKARDWEREQYDDEQSEH